jgi:hypothetical protein
MSESGWSLDDTCATPFAVKSGCDSDPLVFPIVGALDAACSPRSLELFALGEPTEGIQHYGVGNTCAAISEEAVPGFAVTDPIDVATLPKVEPLLGGQGRLRVPLVGVEGVPFGRDQAQPTFFDSEANQGCREVIFDDGSVYCVWESFTTDADYQQFADEQCAGARLFSRSTGTCSKEYEGVVMNAQGCNTVAAEAFSVVPFDGETGYQLSPEGDCAPFLIGPKTPFYVTTAKIDPAETFAPLDVVIVE